MTCSTRRWAPVLAGFAAWVAACGPTPGGAPAQTDAGSPDAAQTDGGSPDQPRGPVEVARAAQTAYADHEGTNHVVLTTPQYATVRGQRYRLDGVLLVDTTTAPYDTVAISYGMGNGNLSCKTVGSADFIELVPFVENVIPGSSDFRQRLGFVFTGDGSTVTCQWRMAIHDPGTGLASASKHYRLAPGSYVQLTTAAPTAYDFNYTQFARNAAQGTRLGRLESTHIAHATHATLTGPTTFVGDLQVNGCRGAEVTCLATDWSLMVTVTAELTVHERHPGVSSGSDWCATQTVFSTSRRFKSDTHPDSPGQHHATVHGSGTWTPSPGCGTSVSVELRAINDTSASDCAASAMGCAVAIYDSVGSRYASVPQRW